MDTSASIREWSMYSFLGEIMRIHEQIPDRAFVFILGAGTSRSSGIPTAIELVDQWLREMFLQDREHSKFQHTSISSWATPERLKIDDFQYDKRAEHYPEVYKLRFGHDPASGHAYLERLMARKEPGLGYLLLAQILSKGRHNVVVTTNFDNLIADSLFICTDQHPLVCGHELLASYIQTVPHRPLIAKVHRDLLYKPHNTPEELKRLAEAWKEPLRKIFKHYTPIVIGYGGNDGSLMGFLEELDKEYILGGIYWCYVGERPNERICSLVQKQEGVLVRILGFDEIMLSLSDRLNFSLLDVVQQIIPQAQRRYIKYIYRVRQISEKLKHYRPKGLEDPNHAETVKAYESHLKRISPSSPWESIPPEDLSTSWWYWERRAWLQPNQEDQEKVFREGIKNCPNSSHLHRCFANFLKFCRKFDEAKLEYEKAHDLNPNNPDVLCDFAEFFAYYKHDKEKACQLFAKALKCDCNNDNVMYKYALFLSREFKHDAKIKDKAEYYFKRSVEIDPNNCFANANYAWWLLKEARYDEARVRVDKALECVDEDMKQPRIELIFYRTLIGVINGTSESTELSEIIDMLAMPENSFTPVPWPLAEVLQPLPEKLQPDDVKLCQKIVEAILDNSKAKGIASSEDDAISQFPPPY